MQMTSITKLRTSQTVKFFDNAVALSLVQAFHRHLDIESLLKVFYSQATATLQLVGMRFKDPDGVYSFEYGDSGPHTTSYNLTYQDTKLGEIVFHFPRRASEDTLATGGRPGRPGHVSNQQRVDLCPRPSHPASEAETHRCKPGPGPAHCSG